MKEYNGVSEGRAEATPELIVYGQQSRCLVSEFVPWEPAMRPPETPAWPALPEVNGLSALGVAIHAQGACSHWACLVLRLVKQQDMQRQFVTHGIDGLPRLTESTIPTQTTIQRNCIVELNLLLNRLNR